MSGARRLLGDYGWPEVEADLAAGIHPEVVAARLGEPIAYLLQIADEHGWPICWQGQTPDEIIDAARLDA